VLSNAAIKTRQDIAGGLLLFLRAKSRYLRASFMFLRLLAVLPLEVLQLGGPPSPSFAQIAASNGENYDPGTLLRSL
jgi:hypothetical protein